MAKPGDIIVGLDIGTTKVCAIVGEVSAEGVDITGVGEARSKGLRKGVVVNIESTVASIREAVDKAGNMAGVEIATVYAGIAGSHVQGINSHGIVSITNHEVTNEDVGRVMEQARHISMPMDRVVLHALPQDYIVDQQDGVREPVGMSGMRLEVRAHLVTAAAASVANVTKCAERCGLHVAEVVLEPLASAEAVLTEDEKEIGVALVDIGGGTTDVVIFVDGALMHTSVIPLGGLNVTADLATGLRTPLGEAERIKIRNGCAMAAMIDPGETIEVASVGGRGSRSFPRQVLVGYIEPRMEEILHMVQRVIAESGLSGMLGAGVVLTGGGTQLEGTLELAECALGMPVRRGLPMGVGGMHEMVKSPSHATAVGLLKYAAMRPASVPIIGASSQSSRTAARAAVVESVAADAPPSVGSRLMGWLKEVF